MTNERHGRRLPDSLREEDGPTEGTEIIDIEDYDDEFEDDFEDDFSGAEEDETEYEEQEEPKQGSLLAEALSNNILTIWRIHGLISDMTGRGSPDVSFADAAAEEMLKGTGRMLARLSSMKQENPLIEFERRRKEKEYDPMDDEEYEKLQARTEEASGYWKGAPECDLLTLCFRMTGG